MRHEISIYLKTRNLEGLRQKILDEKSRHEILTENQDEKSDMLNLAYETENLVREFRDTKSREILQDSKSCLQS
jgi:hypothetical protein